MDPQNYKDVLAFVSTELDIKPEILTMSTRLRQDLKLTLETASSFMADFCYTFMVDRTMFRINDYFATGPQPHSVFIILMSLFGNARMLKTLTIRDLVVAVDKGKIS